LNQEPATSFVATQALRLDHRSTSCPVKHRRLKEVATAALELPNPNLPRSIRLAYGSRRSFQNLQRALRFKYRRNSALPGQPGASPASHDTAEKSLPEPQKVSRRHEEKSLGSSALCRFVAHLISAIDPAGGCRIGCVDVHFSLRIFLKSHRGASAANKLSARLRAANCTPKVNKV